MVRQNIEHLLAVFAAAAGRNGYAEHRFLAFVVYAIVIKESAALIRSTNGPAGEATRDFNDVLLRVAAVYSKRVQLHQLAGVILVQASRCLLAILCVRPRSLRGHALVIVQVEEHCGAGGR